MTIYFRLLLVALSFNLSASILLVEVNEAKGTRLHPVSGLAVRYHLKNQELIQGKGAIAVFVRNYDPDSSHVFDIDFDSRDEASYAQEKLMALNSDHLIELTYKKSSKEFGRLVETASPSGYSFFIPSDKVFISIDKGPQIPLSEFSKKPKVWLSIRMRCDEILNRLSTLL